MATSAWQSIFDHTSDVAFRAWGSELSGKLSAVGMIQTADTGQINWSTVVRAGTTSDAGYEIWRFNDTQQSTAPIYLKLLYGTGSSTSAPRLGYQVGSGTNGAGTINGQNTAVTYSASGLTTATSKNSFISYSDGFFGLVHKQAGYSSQLTAAVFIARTVSSTTQTPNATGASVYMHTSSYNIPNYYQIRFASTASNTLYSSAATWSGCAVPGTAASSLTSSGSRAYMHQSFTPAISPLIGMCTVNVNDIPKWTKFTTTLFGSTPRTYVSLGVAANGADGYMIYPAVTNDSNYCIAMLWE